MKSLALICVLLLGHSAQAQTTKLTLLFTAAPTLIGSFVAYDQGYFAAHGLEMAMVLSPNPSTMPAALLGGSADIAALQMPSLLAANDNGLDLVVLAGTEIYPAPYKQGFLVSPGSKITSPSDLAGHRLGVPGIGATMDILARKLFSQIGVDDRSVIRVEIPLNQMGDALRSGTVDAVTAVEPVYTRIVASGAGVDAGSYEGIIPAGTVFTVYSSTRAWADGHRAALGAMRAAMAEAAAFIGKPETDAAVRESLARWTKLPVAVVATMKLPRNLATNMPVSGISFWTQVAAEQGLTSKAPDPGTLIYPY